MQFRATWIVLASICVLSCSGGDEAPAGDAGVDDLADDRSAERTAQATQFAPAAAASDSEIAGSGDESGTTAPGQGVGSGSANPGERNAAGDIAAQLEQGTALARGRHGVRDEERALSLLISAADAGNLTAQYNLGILHVARGEMRDAWYWFSIAAALGNGGFRDKATWHRNALSLVVPFAEQERAARDANDWLEDVGYVPEANFPADGESRFDTVLPVSNDINHGWRQKLADYQREARSSLGWEPT